MMKPKHYLDLDGASVIQTDALMATRDLVDSVLRHNAIGVVLGDAGMGKTFSLSTALAMRPSVDFIWITLPTDATARLVSQKVVEELTGIKARRIERNELLRLRAQELLLSRRPLVIGDEAQNLDSNGVEAFRYLHDSCGCSFPIVLAGGDGCWETLSREEMLLSRILESVEHTPLNEDDLAEILPAYHPVYSSIDPKVISYIDDRFCRGQFRRWAAFTIKANDRLSKGEADRRLDLDCAGDILKTFPKTSRGQNGR
jgi:hypothetical protein